MSRSYFRWMAVLAVLALVVGTLLAAWPTEAQGGGQLVFDTPLQGTLRIGESHTYTFVSRGREALQVTMTAGAPTLDPILELYDPQGTLIAFSDDVRPGQPDAALSGVLLNQAGVSTLIARSYANSGSGPYTLLASREAIEVLGGGGVLRLGQTVLGEIAVPGQVDRWTFEGQAGQVVTLALSHTAGSGLDPFLELLGPGGATLAASDDDGGGLNSLILGFALPADGSYTALVRSWGNQSTGAYILTLSEGPTQMAGPGAVVTATVVPPTMPTPTPLLVTPSAPFATPTLPFATPPALTLVPPPQGGMGSLEIGQTVAGRLTAGTEDTWTFQGRAGQVISMAVYSRDFDTVLHLLAPSGVELEYDDDGGPGLNSQIRGWQAPESGIYTLRVGSFGGSSGGFYTLTVQPGDQFILPEGWLQGPLPFGRPVQGSFTSDVLTHVWTFEVSAGQYLSLEYRGDLYTEVLTSEGDYGPYFEPGLPVRFEQGGQYYLVVNGYQAGRYSLTLSVAEPPEATIGTIAIGDTVTATLAPGATDEWTFRGQAGQTVSVAMTAQDNSFDTVLRLVDEQGDEIAYNDDSGGTLNSRIEAVTLPADGEYTILAGSFGGRSGGPYTLTLSETEPPQVNSGPIEIGQTVEAQLGPGLEDEWTFVGELGQVISVGVYAPEFDTVLRIVDDNGVELAFDDDGGPGLNSQIRGWQVPLRGAYTIRVGSYGGGAGGSYVLSTLMGDQFVPPARWVQGSLSFGQQARGAFTVDLPIQVWTIEVEADQYVSLEVEGDLFAEAWSMQGNAVSITPGVPAHFEDGGLYYLFVVSFNPQRYTLTLSVAEPPQVNIGTIAIGDTVTATLAPGATDEWTFRGQAGQTVSVAMTAQDNSFDTVLRLVDEQGDEIAYNDDSGGTLNSRIEAVTLPADGEYTILAGSFGGRSGGPYTLALSEGLLPLPTATPAGPPTEAPQSALPPVNAEDTLAIGETAEGNKPEQTMDLWTFEAEAGDGVRIALNAVDDAWDPYLELIAPDGTVLAQDDDGGPGLNSLLGPLALPQAGVYTIRVRAFLDASGGDYVLTLEAAAPPEEGAGVIELGDTVTATLAPGAEDGWTFAGRAGQVVTIWIVAEDNSFDPVLTLLDSAGSEIAFDDDSGPGLNSRIEGVTLPATDSYTIRVRSFSGSGSGPYTLTLVEGVPAESDTA